MVKLLSSDTFYDFVDQLIFARRIRSVLHIEIVHSLDPVDPSQIVLAFVTLLRVVYLYAEQGILRWKTFSLH